LIAFCFYEIDFTLISTEARTQMCASAGGFAMGYNPDMDSSFLAQGFDWIVTGRLKTGHEWAVQNRPL